MVKILNLSCSFSKKFKLKYLEHALSFVRQCTYQKIKKKKTIKKENIINNIL